MAISTNSVIHYTDRIDHLKGILECQGFRIKYCLESLDLKITSALPMAYAMVCFCDIPLSEVKNHIDTYGSYGIGLSKKWAKEQGLNPVLYIEKNSRMSLALDQQGQRIYKLIKEKLDYNETIMEYSNILSFSKNYEGNLVKGKINSDSYRFYDEREWRYIPSIEELQASPAILGTKYKEDKQAFNDKINNCLLKFSFSDISYIIVDNEEEIPEILKTINDVFEDIATSKELKILSTKILTKNQIWNDF
ncbi:abortive infection system antitoxin AbiGi family protein [Flavobacterium mekongense]|uniref:abortive infection system antitoxin AbiGi family protein n=1 Tax=Flavobacterium mekongense TaxID=3379707 RepID=UPI00399AB5A0